MRKHTNTHTNIHTIQIQLKVQPACWWVLTFNRLMRRVCPPLGTQSCDVWVNGGHDFWIVPVWSHDCSPPPRADAFVKPPFGAIYLWPPHTSTPSTCQAPHELPALCVLQAQTQGDEPRARAQLPGGTQLPWASPGVNHKVRLLKNDRAHRRLRPQLRRDNQPNLSILWSRGK